MQPPFWAAIRALVQTLSWMNGGEVALKYPQHWNYHFVSVALDWTMVGAVITHFLLEKALNLWGFAAPDGTQILTGGKGVNPDSDTQT